jgi:hypothetical protein
VTDLSSNPVSGVEILDNSGRSAITDRQGNYYLKGITAGELALAPAKDGYVFAPSVVTLDLPEEAEFKILRQSMPAPTLSQTAVSRMSRVGTFP